VVIYFFYLRAVKALTLPLTTTQLQSTTKMQKMALLQQKIQAKYANDEKTKNQLLAALFQAANVNPLAGCFPALVQIPIFISLYRALQNLIAENKLDEPFLWIPDLQGPTYKLPPGQSLDWIKSAFTGTPDLGWESTLAFLSIPVILFVSQTLSTRVLQPPKDPNKVLTEQEQISQGLVNNIPFIIAFFSLNVPAGLGVYWVINNILTTIITLVVKNQFKDDVLPIEVENIMRDIERDTNGAGMKARMAAASARELRADFDTDSTVGRRPEGFSVPSGFGKSAIIADEVESGSGNVGVVVDVEEVDSEEVDGDEEEDSVGSPSGAGEEGAKKRRKRVKPASRKRRD